VYKYSYLLTYSQCFNTAGSVSGDASCYKILGDEVLAWLPIISCFVKIKMLPFCSHTLVNIEKRH